MPVDVPPYGHSALYRNIALYPELGLYRRFAAYWAKKLHDDTCEFLDRLEEVNREVEKHKSQLGEDYFLDCPLKVVKERCPESDVQYKSLYRAWRKYDGGLMQYGAWICLTGRDEADEMLGRTLCMSEQIMKLPYQDAYYTSHLSEFKGPKFKDLFVGGAFAPTGEEQKYYQDRSEEHDTCAWVSLPNGDYLTTWFQRSGKWIERHILRRLRRSKKSSQSGDQTEVRYDRIVSVMDIMTCLVSSALLTASVLALTWLGPLRARSGRIRNAVRSPGEAVRWKRQSRRDIHGYSSLLCGGSCLRQLYNYELCL
jgi:hypothetical protein